MQRFHSSSFRFDLAPDPAPDLKFIAASEIDVSDFVVELRDTTEATVPAARHARRLNVAQFAEQCPRPAANQRAVFACRSGLRAWQAATHLRSYWDGEITLIAMGDTPATERQPT